jgi:hypothetical protein
MDLTSSLIFSRGPVEGLGGTAKVLGFFATDFLGVGFFLFEEDENSEGRFLSGKTLNLFPSSSVSYSFSVLFPPN